MSRPKGSKNKPKVIESEDVAVSAPSTDEVETIRSPPDRNKRKKEGPICGRCGIESEFDLIIVDTNHFLHVASWNRESPQTYKLCRACCRELSDLADKWYLEKGKGKFDINKELGA